MRRTIGWAWLSVALAVAVGLSFPGGRPPQSKPDDFAALARQFDYDASANPDVREVRAVPRNGYTVHDITYASPVFGRVQAYLLVPEKPGLFAALLFGHWGGGDRTEFLGEAGLYARGGVVCLLPDYPWVRPPQWRKNVQNMARPEDDRRTYAQAAVDLRRGLDILLARKDVDPKRTGYIGHSYGAQYGAILTAVDRRITAAVLVAGVPDLESIYMRTDDPDIEALRKSLPAGQLEAYLAGISTLSAVRYVGRAAPAPLLFQFSNFEPNFPREAMERYFAAASEPKSVIWYDAGHEMADPRVFRDRWAFLAGPLKLPKEPPLGR
jgi:dienelactone hydrolase